MTASTINEIKSIHAAAHEGFNPEGYEVCGVFDLHETEGDHHARAEAVSALVGGGFHAGTEYADRCGHCGQRLRYAALMAHTASQEFIFVGETCLDNCFSLTKDEFARLRENARLNRERRTRQERVDEIIASHPMLLELADDDLRGADSFLGDIWYRLNRDGALSARQIEAVEKAIPRVRAKMMVVAEMVARREALVASGVQVPVGRTEVVGKVISLKPRVDDFSGETVWKMTVEAEAGWRVWMTVPKAFMDVTAGFFYQDVEPKVAVGDVVKVTVTVEAAEGDVTFGFGKRPGKASVITNN